MTSDNAYWKISFDPTRAEQTYADLSENHYAKYVGRIPKVLILALAKEIPKSFASQRTHASG